MHRWLLVLATAMVTAACGAAGPGFEGPSVPFLATPEEVGVEMLRLAGVGADDTVYDLGSGDGRLVVAAAVRFGARGIGVEIDPKLVQQSRERAINAGVDRRVTVRWQDLFQADISDASAVMIYLLPEINLKLRPKLLAELRPGTRIVSHDFDMGDWRPDRTLAVRTPDRLHRLHLWVVPARVHGAWILEIADPGGPQRASLTFEQRFQELTGSLRVTTGEAVDLRGQLRGDIIDFAPAGGPPGLVPRFRGRVDGDRATGVTEIREGSPGGGQSWAAHRLPR